MTSKGVFCMNRTVNRFLSLFLALSLLALMLPCMAGAEEEMHVVILATSDMHGNVFSYSYEDNTESTNNGMARLYTYIQQVRAENPNVFLVDAGDDIQGTIMTDDIANNVPDNEHPVIAAMNYMGYDAMTLGNHEFNWGIETMKKILGQANFPVLGANVLDAQGNYVICGGDFNHDFTGDSRSFFNDGSQKTYSWCQPFPEELIPEGLTRCTDYAEGMVSTSRNTDIPYSKDSFVVILDGFIISDNISCNFSNYNYGTNK